MAKIYDIKVEGLIRSSIGHNGHVPRELLIKQKMFLQDFKITAPSSRPLPTIGVGNVDGRFKSRGPHLTSIHGGKARDD